MQNTLHFKSHLSQFIPTKPSPSDQDSGNLTCYSHQKTPVFVCARNRRRRSGNTSKSTRLILQSAYVIASKLKILPEPLDLIIRECGVAGIGDGATGGGGGGIGFWKGNGWGSFDGWGRKRPRNGRKFGLMAVFAMAGMGLSLYFLWLRSGKELDGDMCLAGLGLGLAGLSVTGWKSGGGIVKDWFLGFCCCAILVSLVLGREELQRLVMKGVGNVKILVGLPRRSRRRKTRRLF